MQKKTEFKIKRVLVLIFYGVILSPLVFSHPTGNSKIKMGIFEDRVEMEVDVNTDDMVNVACHYRNISQMTQARIDTSQNEIAYYLQNRLVFDIDGNPLTEMNVEKWFKEATSSAQKMDSLTFSAATWVFSLVWPFQGYQGTLNFRTQLFAEYEILALCDLKVFWKEKQIIARFQELDRVLSLPLDSASLQAMADKWEKAHVPASQKDGKGIFSLGGILFAVGILLIVFFAILFIKKTKKRK